MNVRWAVELPTIGLAKMTAVGTWAGSLEDATESSMHLHTIDPLSDSRWDDLVAFHPKASVFHQRGWLQALASTYGYRPRVMTSTPPGKPLSNGVVFCEIRSWITGRRLVSLPFADHCEPLLSESDDALEFEQWMRVEGDRGHWRYIELRPLSWNSQAGWAGQSFWFHTLNLQPSLDQVFSGFHKDSIQRRIRRAERERLSYEVGSSDNLLDDFYRLLVTTRKRHRLLPQPREWFRNLIAGMGSNIQIRCVRKNDRPVAALLSLRHRQTVVYKYGCSDQEFHHLAGMPYLFWKLIEESKAAGADQIDFGRTDMDNEGLITFKDRFGTTRSRITYVRYPEVAKPKSLATQMSIARSVFSLFPNVLLPWAGRMVYRHIG